MGIFGSDNDRELADIREQLNRIEAKLDRLSGGDIASGVSENLGELEQQTLELFRSGNNISAIKHWREQRRCGLKEAKEAVEELVRQHG